MSADERLAYEARVRLRQAVLAGLAGVLLVAAAAVQLSGPQTNVNELTLGLITANKRVPLDQIGAVVNAFGLLAVGGTLSFLFGAVRARRPEVQPFIRTIALAGAVLGAISGIVYYTAIGIKAHQFVTHGSQTYPEAHHLTRSGALVIAPVTLLLGSLLLAVGFVMVSLNAMRVGLLTRFMGYLGIFAGVLVLIPIGSPVPVVQGFWLVALAYLISGRWPTGVPPSWRSGRAEPWPSAQELREQRIRASGGAARARPTATPAPEAVGASASRTRSTTPKRKRKRRK
jgi:hypothetical protein